MAHTMRRDPFARVSTSESATGRASAPGAVRSARVFTATSGSRTTERNPRRPHIVEPRRSVRLIASHRFTREDTATSTLNRDSLPNRAALRGPPERRADQFRPEDRTLPSTKGDRPVAAPRKPTGRRIRESRPYSVLFLYPPHLNERGRETYYAHVDAEGPSEAIDVAQTWAADANPSHWEHETDPDNARLRLASLFVPCPRDRGTSLRPLGL